MAIKNLEESQHNILEIMKREPEGLITKLTTVVDEALKKRSAVLKLAAKKQTPFYLLDEKALDKSIDEFMTGFSKHLSGRPYYAIKSNYHPLILKRVVQKGMGLDVSSGRELKFAIKAKAKYIVFSGPGKTDEELRLALKYHKRVIVHVDSFNELKRLGNLSQKSHKKITIGVRFFTNYHLGNKFGIPLDDLREFWTEAKKYPYLELRGLQSHFSWNKDSEKYSKMLKLLADHLKKYFKPEELDEIHFIDLGGGFYPKQIDGFYPWTGRYPSHMHAGALAKLANAEFGVKTEFIDPYYIVDSKTPEEYAELIGTVVKENLSFLKNCIYYAEPGRMISYSSMHIVVKLIDIKKSSVGITDGGINAIGWEFGEHFYMPIINLTHPSKEEIPFTLYGSLCTPRDVWGYYCFASEMQSGDVLIIPNQGAYRYTLAQEFIKAIPPVYVLK
ncbi:MAG: alanine racemase [Candidatus Gracilibacteria bacterium]